MCRLNNIRVHEVKALGWYRHGDQKEFIMMGRNYRTKACVYYYKKTGRVNNTYIANILDWKEIPDSCNSF